MTTKSDAERVLVSTLRAAAVKRVEQTSLRQVARDVGLSPSGLDKFLNGAEPYRKTRRKLEAWYVRGAATDLGQDVSPETVAAAVRILAVFAAPATRGGFVDRLMNDVEPVLPNDSLWRSALQGYGEYMRAGDLEQAAEDTSDPI